MTHAYILDSRDACPKFIYDMNNESVMPAGNAGTVSAGFLPEVSETEKEKMNQCMESRKQQLIDRFLKYL